MARELGDELNELQVHDNISDSTIVLFFRAPTTRENIGYSNEMYQRKGRKVVTRLGETRQKYGARILMGFRKGDFVKSVGGIQEPISSDKNSENYDPEWKELIKERASDMIEILAIHAFESPVEEEEEDPASPEGYAVASPAGEEGYAVASPAGEEGYAVASPAGEEGYAVAGPASDDDGDVVADPGEREPLGLEPVEREDVEKN